MGGPQPVTGVDIDTDFEEIRGARPQPVTGVDIDTDFEEIRGARPQPVTGVDIDTDFEEIRGARNQGFRVEPGQDRKAGSRQTTMVFLGVGLIHEHAQRGLSK